MVVRVTHSSNTFWICSAIVTSYGDIDLDRQILWHLPGSNFTASAQAGILCHAFENCMFKITAISLRYQWVIDCGVCGRGLTWSIVPWTWSNPMAIPKAQVPNSSTEKPGCTVYPKKYAHGFVVLSFVVVMQSFIMNSHEVFIHIHQGCHSGSEVSLMDMGKSVNI